ncbi:MAG TPA: hypothetical protein VIU64_16925 [Polyangia bacterium]
MRRTMTVLAALALLLTTGCSVPHEQPDQLPRVSPTTDTQHVKALCDFFEARPHEVLLTPGAEGNVTVLREATGIPYPLAEAARRYYVGETLNGSARTPIPADRRQHLDAKYKAVIDACTAAGWKS